MGASNPREAEQWDCGPARGLRIYQGHHPLIRPPSPFPPSPTTLVPSIPIMIAPSVRQALSRSGTSATATAAASSSSSKRLAASAATAAASSRSAAPAPLVATRGYATPSRPQQMAQPVDVQPTVRAGRGSTQRKSSGSSSHRGE